MSQQTGWVPSTVDIEKPSAARMYDYLLGGNHNFEVDRAFIGKILQVQPEARRFAIMNRAFLRRAVLFMVERGIRQFLDLGSGIPTVGNVHEIAGEVDADTRVVYVDQEHVAVAHSQLLLEDNQHAVMVQGDITKPGLVLNDQETQRLLDFDKPIGLLAVTIGHYILDHQDPDGVFAAYREALAPGSYLALTHLTDDFAVIKGDELTEMMKHSQNNVRARSKAEVLEFFGDFELAEPGLVTTSRWRPERTPTEANGEQDGLYAGVARKP
ncbi:SAM-dependent methyltransferase [Actinophytocola sediminis]